MSLCKLFVILKKQKCF